MVSIGSVAELCTYLRCLVLSSDTESTGSYSTSDSEPESGSNSESHAGPAPLDVDIVMSSSPTCESKLLGQ